MRHSWEMWLNEKRRECINFAKVFLSGFVFQDSGPDLQMKGNWNWQQEVWWRQSMTAGYFQVNSPSLGATTNSGVVCLRVKVARGLQREIHWSLDPPGQHCVAPEWQRSWIFDARNPSVKQTSTRLKKQAHFFVVRQLSYANIQHGKGPTVWFPGLFYQWSLRRSTYFFSKHQNEK